MGSKQGTCSEFFFYKLITDLNAFIKIEWIKCTVFF